MAQGIELKIALHAAREAVTDSKAPSVISTMYAFVAGAQTADGLNAYKYNEKMVMALNVINTAGYNDRINYQAYREDFANLIQGKATQTREEVAENIAAGVKGMDKETLARFGSFLQSQEKFEFGYLAKRAADGTIAAVLERIYALGPKAPVTGARCDLHAA